MTEEKIFNIAKDMKKQNWNELQNMNVDDAFSYFAQQLQEKIDKHAPEKLIQVPAKQIIRTPWITTALLNSSRHLDKLHKKQLHKPKLEAQHIKYIEFKNLFNKLKRKSKKQYYTDLLNKFKTDTRKTWKILNTIIRKKTNKATITNKFENNGQIITDPKKIAEDFCTYFSQVGEKFAAAIPPAQNTFRTYLKNDINNRSIFFRPTDSNEIDSIISLLKSKKSSGHDNISTEFIKKTKMQLKNPISILVNKSLESGYVPNFIKLAEVIPIFKSKKPELYSNYRPISLLPSIAKILEKVVHKRVYTFLNINNIFYDSQYGFRPKCSTINAITELTSHLLESMDNNQHTVGVFLDLSKAFDTIHHDTLLNKLQYYGIRGIALEWFRSYLTNRKQYVKYKDIKSDAQDITCRVPQGSVLGPLLFIIYTNDLPNALRHSRCILFADDTTVYYSDDNIKIALEKIEQDLKSLTEWFKSNKLSLNVSKTNYMIFTRSQKQIPAHALKIGEENINKVKCTKFLGITIDDSLKWHDHIKYCKNKLSSGLYAINSAKHLLSREHLIKLYYTLIDPYLNYGLILWGSANISQIKKIQMMQNKAIRAITLSNYNCSVKPLFKQLHVLTIEDLYKLHLSKLMYLHSKNALPTSISNIFITNTSIHSHYTRHQNDPHVKSRNTYHISQSFLHRAPDIWYQIPQEIKSCNTINSFTRQMKKTNLDIKQTVKYS